MERKAAIKDDGESSASDISQPFLRLLLVLQQLKNALYQRVPRALSRSRIGVVYRRMRSSMADAGA